jgi:hypothetical protein
MMEHPNMIWAIVFIAIVLAAVGWVVFHNWNKRSKGNGKESAGKPR